MFFATHPSKSRTLTAIEALQLIAEIAERVGMDRATFDEEKQKMTIDPVLMQIYSVAHAHDAGCGCHGVHGDWRAEAVVMFDALCT